MRPYQLSENEVANRVEQYRLSEVTESLYRFGTMMIQENLDRTKQLEGKLTAVAGYSGAILALLMVRPPDWLKNPIGWQAVLLMCAGLAASFAIALSLLALRARKQQWFSDSQWFENENDLLDDTDRLKRYHVIAMHGVNQQMGRTNEQKAFWLFMAQVCLAVAALSITAILWVPTFVRTIPDFLAWLCA